MIHLKLINVDNGDSSYPGSFAKKEIEIIKHWVNPDKTLHLFSGNSDIGKERVDFANENATVKCDVFDFLRGNVEKYDYVILDPPYNDKFADKYNKKSGVEYNQFVVFADSKKTSMLFDLICKKVDPKCIIMKSWYYYILNGYEFNDGYICYAGGFRKPTFLLKMVKVGSNEGFLRSRVLS